MLVIRFATLVFSWVDSPSRSIWRHRDDGDTMKMSLTTFLTSLLNGSLLMLKDITSYDRTVCIFYLPGHILIICQLQEKTEFLQIWIFWNRLRWVECFWVINPYLLWHFWTFYLLNIIPSVQKSFMFLIHGYLMVYCQWICHCVEFNLFVGLGGRSRP